MKKKDLHNYNLNHIPDEHKGAFVERLITSYNKDRNSKYFKELEDRFGDNKTIFTSSYGRISEDSYNKEKHFLEIRKLKLEALIEEYPEYYIWIK